MIYICLAFIAGFLTCLAMVFIAARMELKRSVDEKKQQLHEKLIYEGQVIGLDGYLPTGKRGRK
jgi:hypothetical protein